MEHERLPDVWPLQRGDTLSNHDWFPFHVHRFLGSKFLASALMERRRGDVGSAVILWCEAMRQDPAGTLPDCDIELASLARYATVEDWQAVKTGVLHGWEQVYVDDARTGAQEIRLGHTSFMQSVVMEMHKRKRSRDGAREAANQSVRKSRIRKKMNELGIQQHIVGDDRVLAELASYFEQSDIYITADNVKAAMVSVIGYTGQVRTFPGAGAGSGG